MLQYIQRQRGKWHYGKELRESAQAKAERLIAEACRLEAVSQEQLEQWQKGHPFKVELALKLRTQTTVTVEWIAHRLQMGTRGHAAHLLSGAKNRNLDVNQPTVGI
jgi:hypothetical protein